MRDLRASGDFEVVCEASKEGFLVTGVYSVFCLVLVASYFEDYLGKALLYIERNSFLDITASKCPHRDVEDPVYKSLMQLSGSGSLIG